MTRTTLVLLMLAVVGCEGRLIAPGPYDPTDPTNPNNPNHPNNPNNSNRPELPAASSRMPRLSHVEYDNTVTDLLQATPALTLSSTFVDDATSTTFNNNGGELTINSDGWADYQRAAEQLAKDATVDTAALAKIAGGTAPGSGDEMIRVIGRRVFRRPLADAEVAQYQTLYAQGATFYPGSTALLSGARVVLEAMLQSPHFLYRPELSNELKDGKVALSAHELATRLSYALWQTSPDEALLAAADNGTLLIDDQYQAQLSRLLDHQNLRRTVRAFHSQLLQVTKIRDVTRSSTLFPDFTQALVKSLEEEPLALVDDVVFGSGGGLKALLTANYSFVDAPLAKVYGLQGDFSGTGLKKVTFTDGKRAGLLTMPGFLTINAMSTEPDPIHRGVFINHRILCANLPAPPNMVPKLPDAVPGVPKTMRQRITEHTGEGTCGAGCHSTMINPAGFAYEHFDAIGKWRDTDNGLPVDSADSYQFDGERRTYGGATEFGQVISEEEMAHRCYAGHLLEFLHARGVNKEQDKNLIERVMVASKQGGEVKSLLRALVDTDAFRSRAQ